jgi:MFS family permease
MGRMSPSSRERPFAELPRGLAPLGYRNFALYWIGFATSNVGRHIELTGLVWLVYELTHSPVLLGLLGIARAGPAIVVGPIAGVVADRVDQRRLLFITQLLALVASLCLGLLVVTGLLELWHVYVQVALQAVITGFDSAVRQALFPRLVPRARLVEAVTLQHSAGRASQLVGPAVGGFAIAGLGEAAPFLLNAATYLVLMAAVTGISGVIPRTATAGSSFRGELVEGLRHVMGAPVLSGLIKLEIVFHLFSMNPVMITIVGREVLGVGAEGLGGLLSAPALGALVGIASVLVLGLPRRQGRFVIFFSFAYAATLLAFAASGDYAFSFTVLAVMGLFGSLVGVARSNVMQLAAPGRMRGRVMANMSTVSLGIGPLAQSQSGVLAGAVGSPLAVVSAAVAIAVAAAAIARANPLLWNFSQDEALRESVGPASPPPAPDVSA